MKSLFLLVTVALFLCSPVLSQDLGLFEEVTAGNFFGIGAKQMAMGGTGIAHGWDGAAIYYNPASLARVYRIEFQASLTHQNFNSKTEQSPDRYDGFASIQNGQERDISNTRLGGLNLTIPVPTYRGSLVVGFGAFRLINFDRTWQLKATDRIALNPGVETFQSEEESGGIYLYTAGAGIDLSPGLSIGAAFNIYSGDRKLTYLYNYFDSTNNYSDGVEGDITEDYIGLSVKAGLLARPNHNLSIGLVFESPLDWQVQQTAYESSYFDEDGFRTVITGDNFAEYDLIRPFIIGGGVAYRIRTFTLTGDMEYIDWSQMEYGDNPELERQNESLRQYYRSILNLRIGAEYQFPKIGLALRGGFFSNPLANDRGMKDGSLVETIDKDRLGYSLGLGWLIDRTLMIEGSYLSGSFGNSFTAYNGFVTERDDSFRRIYLTASFRY